MVVSRGDVGAAARAVRAAIAGRGEWAPGVLDTRRLGARSQWHIARGDARTRAVTAPHLWGLSPGLALLRHLCTLLTVACARCVFQVRETLCCHCSSWMTWRRAHPEQRQQRATVFEVRALRDVRATNSSRGFVRTLKGVAAGFGGDTHATSDVPIRGHDLRRDGCVARWRKASADGAEQVWMDWEVEWPRLFWLLVADAVDGGYDNGHIAPQALFALHTMVPIDLFIRTEDLADGIHTLATAAGLDPKCARASQHNGKRSPYSKHGAGQRETLPADPEVAAAEHAALLAKLCTMLRADYACLGYAMPAECAS